MTDKTLQERDAAVKAFDRIKRALLPDPHDERDVSIDWLRKEIHAAIAEREGR